MHTIKGDLPNSVLPLLDSSDPKFLLCGPYSWRHWSLPQEMRDRVNALLVWTGESYCVRIGLHSQGFSEQKVYFSLTICEVCGRAEVRVRSYWIESTRAVERSKVSPAARSWMWMPRGWEMCHKWPPRIKVEPTKSRGFHDRGSHKGVFKVSLVSALQEKESALSICQALTVWG